MAATKGAHVAAYRAALRAYAVAIVTGEMSIPDTPLSAPSSILVLANMMVEAEDSKVRQFKRKREEEENE